MKLSRKQKLAFVAAAVSLAIGISAYTLFAVAAGHKQTSIPQDNTTTLRWAPHPAPINSKDSRFKLQLTDLAASGDWIVGVQPTEGNEPETISVGLVSWGTPSPNETMAKKAISAAVISQIEDLPLDGIQSRPGLVTLNGLGQLSRSQSVVVQLKVAPGTKVRILNHDREFANDAEPEGLIIHNGTITSGPPKGIKSLLAHLTRSKMLHS